MTENPLITLRALGQSPWYDFITRELMASGELSRLIAEDGLMGMTSNPTIFEKAITGSSDYDDDIRRFSAAGATPAAVFEALAVADVQSACDFFLPVYRDTDGNDGLVSLEVSPTLAHDTRATIEEAARLWHLLARPNAMIKIPGTSAGLEAISECLNSGINVNVTLLFSVKRHRAVMEAYISALENRATRGEPIDRIASVASFFVSRVDTRVDPMLDAAGLAELKGRTAIANAQVAYRAFLDAFSGPRWEALQARGARAQRPLWASTSTKDPALPDTYYVEALVGSRTVNTLPPDTFNAYRDHGNPTCRITDGNPLEQLERVAAAGIDLDQVTDFLEGDGVAKFAASYQSLLAGIETKAARLK